MASIDNVQLPFDEQIKFFRQKLNLGTERWDDIKKSAHDRSFVVAGAMKGDLLSDLRKSVDEAIANGISIGEFRKQFDATVAKHGWTGFKGEGSKAGVAWRTKVIYQTNISSSYAAGRLKQLRDPELLKLKPLWMYKHNDSVTHPRPLHVSWDKTTLPPDDDWWKTHYTPNGWGCKCRIVAVSRKEAEREGGKFKAPSDWKNTDGIDEGWDYMPGDTWARWDKNTLLPDCGPGVSFAEKRKCHPKPAPDQDSWKTLGLARIRNAEKKHFLEVPTLLEPGKSWEDAVEVLAGVLGVSREKPVRIIKDVRKEPIPIVHDWLPHMVENRTNMRERYANFILPTLTNPFEIWATAYDDKTIRPRYIGLYAGVGARDIMVVVRKNRDGSVFYNFMQARHKDMDTHRMGARIYVRK